MSDASDVSYTLSRDDETVVRTVGDVTSAIPRDEGNSDYQDFLLWVDDGGTPQSAPAKSKAPPDDTNRATILDNLRIAWTDLGTYLALGAASTTAQDKAVLRLCVKNLRSLIRVTIGKLDGTD